MKATPKFKFALMAWPYLYTVLPHHVIQIKQNIENVRKEMVCNKWFVHFLTLTVLLYITIYY